MGIPAVVESEDQLPEGLTDYYQQDENGQFVLDAEGVDSHPEVQGLKSSLQKQKQDREKLRKERDKLKSKADMLPDDVDQDTLHSVLDRLRNGEGDGSGNDGQDDGQNSGQQGRGQQTDPARIRQQIEQRYQKEIEQRDQAIQAKDQQVRQLVVDQGLTAALQKHGVTKPGRLKGAKKLLADQVQIQEGDDGSIQAVVETDLGEQGIDQFVKEWLSSDEGADYLDGNAGSGAPGSGSGGSGGAKTVSREKFDAMDPAEKQKFIKNGGRISG